MRGRNGSHRRRSAWLAAVLLAAGAACALPGLDALRAPPGLPDLPSWGRGRWQPSAANAIFATGDGCALCHSASERADALWSATGEDVSPHGLWQATMMANAGRDPYWHAQVAKETAANPEMAGQIEALCVRCHMPTMHHTYAIAGVRDGAPRIAEGRSDPLFADGVTCTVCHQIQPQGLGEERTFSGRGIILPERTIFGPYEDPAGGPMKAHSAFTPTQGAHISSSALCATCHTLKTEHVPGAHFDEQTPYLEWRNSVFSDEGGPTAESRTCQQCHMADVGDMRIARNPMGTEFNIETRKDVRAHAFVGGNAFMLDLFREKRKELGVQAPAEALERMARATRTQLSHRTARLEVTKLRREADENGQRRLVFDVTVENLTGHKFPTGYPARRAWLEISVRDGGRRLFECGKVDERGRLVGVEDELSLPHRDVIEDPSHVQVYEMVAADEHGEATTYLTRMATKLKDNRLLPRGYAQDGPHSVETAPAGVGDDFGPGGDFIGGSDTVTCRVPLPEGAWERGDGGGGGGLVVVVWLWYQPIPPAWVAPLREVEHADAARFVTMYDDAVAGGAAPEQVAVAVAVEE